MFCICTGHFLHLRLLPTTTIRTLNSPTFGMTKETCRLEMYVHQSGNKNGKLRVVIEAVNSSSWVPNQRVGFEVCMPLLLKITGTRRADENHFNTLFPSICFFLAQDNHRWTELIFPIGKVSQDFRILFEVVPGGLRSQQRGHVR